MNNYLKLKNKHEKILNEFPKFFAFDNSQFEEGLKKLNINKENVLSVGLSGFIRKSDKKQYIKMWKQINKESKESLKDEEYLFNAFRYELANHEFIITYDYENTLNCLGLSFDKLTDKQKKILNKAKNEYLKDMEKNEKED